MDGVTRGAFISPDKLYRYHLWRRWDLNLPAQLWILLNPSTADANIDDPTIVRLMNRAQRAGAGALIVCNLFAYRATNPLELRKVEDKVGPENDRVLDYAVAKYATHPQIMAGWGVHGHGTLREKQVIDTVTREYGRALYAAKLTTEHAPSHPLYVPYEAPPLLWREAA